MDDPSHTLNFCIFSTGRNPSSPARTWTVFIINLVVDMHGSPHCRPQDQIKEADSVSF